MNYIYDVNDDNFANKESQFVDSKEPFSLCETAQGTTSLLSHSILYVTS